MGCGLADDRRNYIVLDTIDTIDTVDAAGQARHYLTSYYWLTTQFAEIFSCAAKR